MLIYLNVETYSLGEEPRFSDKVILVCYKEVDDPTVFWKEWEADKKEARD